MKAAVHFAASLIAAAGLLAGSASHATDVAELPLKASVLAKPNIIFAMDDSGSMDSEMLLDTNNGYFWWNYSTGVGYSNGLPAYGGGNYDWAQLYLFPDGTGTGNRVYGEPAPSYGYGVPPTPDLAWLRSAAYNPLYYDPSKTYSPWSPGYVNGALMTYGNAPPGAAPSHPAQGTTTLTLNANINSSTDSWKFTWITGMTIPTGVTGIACVFNSFPGTLPYTVPSSRGLCKGQMSYYPATYWQRQSCTIDGSTCVAAPDGQTLQRYEIKSGNTFPSGRSYTDEMQNFANWFTYYRKRRLMLAGSMGSVLENLTGLRMGLVPFTPFNPGGSFSSPVTMYDADNTSSATNRFNIIGKFQTAEGSGGTPTRETLKYVGDQFNRTDPDTLGNKIVQYACQRNNSFVVTDGFAFPNVNSYTTPPAYSQATYGGGPPYSTTYGSTLADIALSYYTNQLRTDLAAGRVPTDATTKLNSDQNSNLHVNTYGMTLGAKGNLWPANTTANAFTNPPTWVNPTTTDRNAIDDLWHATINGRGQMYLVTSVADTTTAILAAVNDILSSAGAQSGVAVSTVNLSRGDGYAYLGTYNPAGWTGDLTANTINANTAAISPTPTWSAGANLLARDWTTRVIASANSSGVGVGFTATDVGSVVNPNGNWGDTNLVMNYLRGDRSQEGTTFRTRTALMGAIINSQPTIDADNKVVYVASGEGMLHAIDTTPGSTAGQELWAFVPRENLQDMGQTTARYYVFQTQLDGTPVIGQSGTSSKLLVAGMGAAGRSYYAIDVTAPRSYTQAQLATAYKWEFPTANDSTTRAKMGQTVGAPLIVRTANNGYVVLVTSGYNSTADGMGRLWMLNAADGTVIKEFVVNAGTLGAESGLAQVSGYLEDDGTVQYVYGGDLLGNVWRFDLKNQDTPKLVAVLTNASGTAQPVTAAPELALVQNQRVILIGTGRILDITDFGNSSVQTFYAIADGATLSPARNSLVQQTYTHTGDVLVSNPVDWTVQRGWFMDLPSGEQANTHPRIAYGSVSFVTNVNGATDCSASSYLYVLDVASGSKAAGAAYVSTQISASANSAGPTPVATANGQPYDLLQTNDGQAKTEILPAQQQVQPSRNSWREVLTQ